MLTLIRQHKLKCGTNLISYVTLLRLRCIIITLSRTQNVSEKNACLFLLGSFNFIIFCLTHPSEIALYIPSLKTKELFFCLFAKSIEHRGNNPLTPLILPYLPLLASLQNFLGIHL
ncbi:hypothetical protein V8G54_024224 [Vigna mungo]|uniref:Uncharacterized protein n=1 Tax=Vigna mungo TaxID=3915 RepID=A0AAQ3N6Z1_VIGMU